MSILNLTFIYEDEFGSWLLINKLSYSNFHWPRKIQTGSLMSHSFAAYIAYHKYELGIPFHHLSRHIKEFLNLDMSKQNLANTMAKLSNIIKPVYEAMKKDLLNNTA